MTLILIYIALCAAVFGYDFWQEIKFQQKLSDMAKEIRERDNEWRRI